MSEISKATRMTNYIIDIAIILITCGIIEVILTPSNSAVVYYIVYVIYYFIFESFYGQTIGKMITNTVIVDMNNLKPSVGIIGLRTILRLNPLDGFSYLFGQEQGGHDLLSNTRLKRKKHSKFTSK
ncbi:MAG: putative RDD family membrane protein YckC [Crocinitomix sp.]|jgi:uncharacterized RDD family membrane protein YckC